LPLIVTFIRVGLEENLQQIPPPQLDELFVIATFVSTGLEEVKHANPPPSSVEELSFIVTFVKIGLDVFVHSIPPPSPTGPRAELPVIDTLSNLGLEE
jgi:hypothetical protein|tara:strand:+ start:274 stop:567 length:294 start_codon:yes stop_codon:yes gene_type:complete